MGIIEDDRRLQMLADAARTMGAGMEKAMLTQIEQEKLHIIQKYHKRSVHQIGGTGRFAGWWQTRFGHGKGSQEIKTRTLGEMYEYILHYYGHARETLKTYFPRWLSYMQDRGGRKASTAEHNRNAYAVYVAGTPLETIPLVELTPEDLNDWARDLLIRKPLNASRFNTYKIVVTGPLDLAVREGILDHSPWIPERMDYKALLRAKRRAPSGRKIFYEDEIRQIIAACRAGHMMTRSSTNIAIMINFELGLRVGELSALKWLDVDWKNQTVFIQRQESEHEVEDYVKSDSACGYRELPLSDAAAGLLHALHESAPIGCPWVFANADGSRKTSKAIQQRLIHIQEHLGMLPVKRIHCQRRTVGTRIARDRGLEAARQWLGHTDIQTTLRYVYTTETIDSMRTYVNSTSILAEKWDAAPH